MPPRGPVVVDLSPAQSPGYGERGIARHTVEFTRALVSRHPHLVGHLLVDPHRPPPPGLETWAEHGALPAPEWQPAPGTVLHLISPFELDQPLDRLWPPAARRPGVRLVVTVHDLIPELFPADYLADPGLRRRWRARRALVQAADAVLAVSAATAADTEALLGIPRRRITVIGAGSSPAFRPPGDRAAAAAALARALPGVGERFVVYNGGDDPRKNVGRLLEAWARLPGPVGAGRQLVIAGHLAPGPANHLQQRAAHLGIAPSVLWAGRVSEEVLVGLYQAAELMVFPSLYEGYGLPVVEALACGAPVIAAGNSCLVELVPAEATFDATDPAAIASAITRGLADAAYRRRLLAATGAPPPQWADVADRAAAVYLRLAAEPALSATR